MSLLIGASSTGCAPQADPAAVELNGRIEAALVDLAPRVSGRVAWVGVKEGDGVESARARLQALSLGSRQPEIAAAEAEVVDRRAVAGLLRSTLLGVGCWKLGVVH